MAEDDETTTLPVSPLRITVRPLRSRLEQELELADQQSSNPLPTYQPLALPVERPDYLMPQQAIPGQPTPFAQQAIRDSWPVKMVGSGITLPADVVAGKVDPVSDEGITRSVDLAGLGSVGPMAMAKAGTGVIPALPAFFKKGLPLEERMAEWVQMQKQNMQNSPTLMSDSGTPGSGIAAVANSQHAPAFYSAVEQTVKNAKMQKGTADQWIGYLRNQAGVKPEELQWTGLNELPKGQISKADLEKHIAENKVQIGEVTKGDLKFNKQSKYALPEVVKAAKEASTTPGDLELVLANDGNAYRALTKKFPNLAENENWAEIVSKDVFGGDTMPTGTSKYSKYQLPGATNYKETLLTLPNAADSPRYKALKAEADSLVGKRDPASEARRNEIYQEYDQLSNQQYKSSHWDEPNVLAHIRTNDRMIDGKKTLHIEEIQSDWHQAGRKQGYNDPVVKKAAQEEYSKFTVERDKLISKYNEHGNLIAARSKMTPEDRALEHDLSQKIVDANEQITSGVPDAPFKKTWDELALKNIIRKAAEGGYDAVSWTPGEAQAARYDLSKHITDLHYNPETQRLVANNNQQRVIDQNSVKPEKLIDFIGKEAAEKLMKQEPNVNGLRSLRDQELKVGGEGMKAFYDKMLVDKANTIGKKFGSKVEEKKTSEISNYYDVPGYKGGSAKSQPVHYLPITKEMREHALSRGFPLFSSGLPVITPVQGNPFTDKKYKIIPMHPDYNPFTNKDAT